MSLFGDSPRVKYRDNPLIQVICQLKFPTILKIQAEAPALFQDKIRGVYPLFQPPQAIMTDVQLPPELLKLLTADLANSGLEQPYEFSTVDKSWTVSLGKDFVALNTAKYQTWEEFHERLLNVVEALVSAYLPAFFTRVGLRYRNNIVRSVVGLDGVPWAELLRPEIAGPLLNEMIASNLDRYGQEMLVKLPEFEAKLHFRHGLVRLPDVDESCYAMDADFFTEPNTGRNKEIANAEELLNYFNGEAGRLFRACISPRLHEALGPAAIPD